MRNTTKVVTPIEGYRNYGVLLAKRVSREELMEEYGEPAEGALKTTCDQDVFFRESCSCGWTKGCRKKPDGTIVDEEELMGDGISCRNPKHKKEAQ